MMVCATIMWQGVSERDSRTADTGGSSRRQAEIFFDPSFYDRFRSNEDLSS